MTDEDKNCERMFTWKPLYKEIAAKALTFRERQKELLALLAKLKKQGMAIMPLADRGDETMPMTEIDPFTFFSVFNRPITKEKRIAIIEALKAEWNLKSAVPTDLTGIPVVNAQNSWFFSYASHRAEDDVPKLWRLAEETIKAQSGSFDGEALKQALTVRQVGITKATMGMFWLNPDEFIAADQYSREFLSGRGITLNGESAEEYLNWLREIRERVGTNFAELSHEAYVAKTQNPHEPKPPQLSPVRFWTLSAGANGDQWDEFFQNRIVAIGWEVSDLRTFKNQDQLREALKEAGGSGDSRKNDTLACWQFCNDMKPNDIVFVKQGFRKILGVARITGAYEFDDNRPIYKHLHTVEWIANGEWILEDDSRLALKTLTEISTYPDFVAKLADKTGVDLGLAQTDLRPRVQEEKQYWWLNANPKMWDFNRVKIGHREGYTTHTEKGTKRRIYQYFAQVQPDDAVVVYVTKPDMEITGLGRITKSIYKNNGEEQIEFEKTEQFTNPVSLNTLKAHPDLKNCEPVLHNQGSLFKLSESEYETIVSLIEESKPPATPTVARYSKTDALEELFVSEAQFDQMLRALRDKRNLILQGPPGVGKTFVAERLAFSLMEYRDNLRIAKVQFHQSYSYEDFIQGYRPSGDGQFELKNGLFHQFCRRAQRDPERRPHVFIIDEINRGNLSKIFGELLMLIEPDKRGEKHAIPLTYSPSVDDVFFVPENLHIIGTMNTADRSLALVDYALRRRFRFMTLQPEFESERFRKHLIGRSTEETLIKRIVVRLAALNQRIASDDKNLGEGYRIGHSYFCPVNGTTPNDAWYRAVVEDEIKPLLEEYWFDDRKRVTDECDALLAP